MRSSTPSRTDDSALDWLKAGQTVRFAMWQFPVPKPAPGLALRPDDWFSDGTAFDSPEDLVQALQLLPEAPGTAKLKRRFPRRAHRAEAATTAKSRWRVRSLIFALLIVAIPLVATEATSGNAVTADLHVRHAIAHGTNILAPAAITQPSSQVGAAGTTDDNSSGGNPSSASAKTLAAQVAGVSVAAGAQATQTPPVAPTPTPLPPPASPNLLTNPSFESNGNGWAPSGGALYRCSNCGTPEDGKWVMQVSPNYSSLGTQYAIQTSPGYVGTQGQQYTASIWVRSYNSVAVGHTVTVGISESLGSGFGRGSVVQSPNATVSLTLAWQKVTVVVTQKYSGTY